MKKNTLSTLGIVGTILIIAAFFLPTSKPPYDCAADPMNGRPCKLGIGEDARDGKMVCSPDHQSNFCQPNK